MGGTKGAEECKVKLGCIFHSPPAVTSSLHQAFHDLITLITHTLIYTHTRPHSLPPSPSPSPSRSPPLTPPLTPLQTHTMDVDLSLDELAAQAKQDQKKTRAPRKEHGDGPARPSRGRGGAAGGRVVSGGRRDEPYAVSDARLLPSFDPLTYKEPST